MGESPKRNESSATVHEYGIPRFSRNSIPRPWWLAQNSEFRILNSAGQKASSFCPAARDGYDVLLLRGFHVEDHASVGR
jgi:hypothetical protein